MKNPAGDSDSIRLLLRCLMVSDDLPNSVVLALPLVADWEEALEIAQRDQIVPLFYWQLSARQQTHGLPAGLSERLNVAYRSATLDNLAVLRNASQVMHSLHQSGIAVMPLKGVFLADKVYPNPGVRGMGDIDLLIKRSQLTEAVERLREAGFYSLYPFDIDQECSVSHHLPSLYGLNGIVIELHWTLIPPKAPIRIPIERIWEESTPGSVFGAPCQTISPVDLIIHLCLHAAYLDYFASGLRPICDIAWSLQVYQKTIDWADLVQRSSEWGVTRSVWLGLRIAQELLNAPVPGEAILNLQPDDIGPKIVDWAKEQVIHPMRSGGKLASIWAEEGWRGRAQVFLNELFPAPEEMKPYYPNLARGMLWPAAYLKHLGVVIRRNWLPVWGLITGDPTARESAEQREHVNQMVRWLEAG